MDVSFSVFSVAFFLSTTTYSRIRTMHKRVAIPEKLVRGAEAARMR